MVNSLFVFFMIDYVELIDLSTPQQGGELELERIGTNDDDDNRQSTTLLQRFGVDGALD